ncbi:hypothetical protein [Scytonema sp. HK-05]
MGVLSLLGTRWFERAIACGAGLCAIAPIRVLLHHRAQDYRLILE